MKEEKLKNAMGNTLANITKTSLNGTTSYTTVLDEEGKEYSDAEQYLRVYEEYKLIKKKESKLGRRDRDMIVAIFDGLISRGELVLDVDNNIIELNGKKIRDEVK